VERLVVPYDARWPELFAGEAARVRDALGPRCLGVEHIGSTAVPGLPSKPVVDLLVGLPDALTRDDARALKGLGYRRLRVRRDGRLVFRRGTPRAYSLHVAEVGTWAWHRPLGFRDLLRRRPEEVERYAALKLELARTGDLPAYVEGKAAFIESALREAAPDGALAVRKR
jgi:GrpB-like predicted nucleotidyltransferase (UPF0157 family)